MGQLAANIVLMVSPERVVFGGGVMGASRLLRETAPAAAQVLNGYSGLGPAPESLDNFIVAPGLGERSGIVGAFALAKSALAQSRGGPME